MEAWSLVGTFRLRGWGRGTSPDSQSSDINYSNATFAVHSPLGPLSWLGFSNSSVVALDFHLTGAPRGAISPEPSEFIFCGANDLQTRSIKCTVVSQGSSGKQSQPYGNIRGALEASR